MSPFISGMSGFMQPTKYLPNVRRLAEAMKSAFAVGPTEGPLNPAELALLDRIATTIVARQMGGPAVLFLDAMGPMNFLGSQVLHFLTPILDCACNTDEIEQAARLLERRDAVPRLVALIEAKSVTWQSSP
jgi:hypothetical protein